MSSSSCLWPHSTPPCCRLRRKCWSKNRAYLLWVAPTSCPRDVINTSARELWLLSLPLVKWKLIRKIRWWSYCISTFHEKSPVPWGNKNQLAASRQASALCHICSPDQLSPYPGLVGEKGIQWGRTHTPALVSILLKRLPFQQGLRYFMSLFSKSYTQQEIKLGSN